MRRTVFGGGFVMLLAVACSDPTPDNQGGGGSTSQAVTSTVAGPTTATTATGTATASSTSGDASTASSSSQGGGGGAGGAGPLCSPYPVPLSFPDTQPAAQAELDAFAPGATMTWSTLHGTPQSVNGLNVTLDCAAHGNDTWEAAWAVLSAHPALFELDRTEWAPTSPFPCSAVTPLTLVNTYRTGLAGIGVKKDVLAIYVSPTSDGGVTLQTVSGFYLPVLAPGDIQDCPNASDPHDDAAIRAGTYPYATFSQCTPTGSGTYTPQPNDVIEYDTTWWEWEDDATGVTARKYRSAHLIIDPSNATNQIIQSDLNCPDPMNDDVRIYGYTLTLDAITGEVLDAIPGIGCIVC